MMLIFSWVARWISASLRGVVFTLFRHPNRIEKKWVYEPSVANSSVIAGHFMVWLCILDVVISGNLDALISGNLLFVFALMAIGFNHFFAPFHSQKLQ